MAPTQPAEIPDAEPIEKDKASAAETAPPAKRPLSWLTTTLIFLNLTLLGLAIFTIATFGSIRGAIRYINGQFLVVDESLKSFGVTDSTQRPSVIFQVTNRSNESIRLLGCRTTCNCVTPERLPLTLKPGETRPFQVSFRPSDHPSVVHMPMAIYTNNPDQPTLTLWIDGEVVRPPLTDESFNHPAKSTIGSVLTDPGP
jgi:hypothetical protein